MFYVLRTLKRQKLNIIRISYQSISILFQFLSLYVAKMLIIAIHYFEHNI